ncbi:MAG: hypothetical protein KIT31_25525 [Deltaproteobacteria bacterium]|nr:hypothetical protein [Deltaproteobacteria bacterium]
MKSLACVLAFAAVACVPSTEDGDGNEGEVPATDLPPGAASAAKADGQLLDVTANHCEVFFDRVVTSRSSHALLRVRLYVKTLNFRLDGEIAEVAYYANVDTEGGAGTCGDSSACQFRGQWHAYRAQSFVDASDYWTLDFTLNHDFTSPLVYEGVLYVRTVTGKTYWVNPDGGGNFFVDRNMAFDVEHVLGGPSLSRGTGPEHAAVTADIFPYLNPRRCR